MTTTTNTSQYKQYRKKSSNFKIGRRGIIGLWCWVKMILRTPASDRLEKRIRVCKATDLSPVALQLNA